MARSEGSLGSVVGVRLPGGLEARLKAEAEQQGLSLSAYIRTLLEAQGGGLRGLGAEAGYTKGWEEGLRASSSAAQRTIVAALKKLWPK